VAFQNRAYRTMSGVSWNGGARAHEVIYGQRTVGAEFMCYQHDMLDAKKHTHHCIRQWLEQSGYAIAADAAAVAKRYEQMKGSYALIQEARLGK